MNMPNTQNFSITGRCFIFVLLLAALAALAGCGKDEPDGLMADALPHREELAEYESMLKNNPHQTEILLALQSIKLRQAQEADWSIRPGLLRESMGYLQKYMELDEGMLLKERVYLELARISALLGGSLKNKKESASAFQQGWDYYQKAEDAALLRSASFYTPSLGWVKLLADSTDMLQGKNKSVERIWAEFTRLVMDEGFIKPEHPGQRMFWAETLLLGANKGLPAKDKERMLDKGLAEASKALAEVAAMADSGDSRKQSRDLREGANRVNMLKTVALLGKIADTTDAKKQQELLPQAHDALRAYFRTAGDWPDHSAREFAAEIGPNLWRKLDESLAEDPLRISARAMWLIMFPEDKKRDGKLAAAKPLLDQSLALAPANERIVAAYVDAMRLDSYGSPWYKEPKLPMYERLACLQKTDYDGWRHWSESYHSDIGWQNDPKFSEKKDIMLTRIDALDAELSCPSFSAYARGMIDKRMAAKAYLEAAASFEKAAALPHPKGAGALIYGELGSIWRNAYSQNYLKEKSGKNAAAEEYLGVLDKAREAFRLSLEIHRGLPLEQQDGRSDYQQAQREVYAALLACPAREIDGALLAEIKSQLVPGQNPDEKLWNRRLAQISHDARAQLRKFSGSGGLEERRIQLYDLSIEALEASMALGEASPGIRQSLAAELHERAMLDQAGRRGERLQRALKIYTELQGEKISGLNCMAIAAIKLRLSSEVDSGEIGTLLDEAYADFCLAAGLPENSTRARLAWAQVLEDEAEKQTPQGAEALRTRAMQVSSK